MAIKIPQKKDSSVRTETNVQKQTKPALPKVKDAYAQKQEVKVQEAETTVGEAVDAYARFPHRKKVMLEMLVKTLGIVTTACKQAGIHRRTHYDWMEADAEYKKAVAEIDNIALDFAESQLHKQISAGEVSSTIFYLKTKGKKRGYVERTEYTGKDGADLIPFNWETVHSDKNTNT